jgi:hypothetical protein
MKGSVYCLLFCGRGGIGGYSVFYFEHLRDVLPGIGLKNHPKITDLYLISERKKIKRSSLGLAKKDKQLDERKLCSFFAKPQKQTGLLYFSSIT